MRPVSANRLKRILTPDPQRLITKAYLPSDADPVGEQTRIERVMRRVIALTPAEVSATLEELRRRFSGRHGPLDEVFSRGFLAVAPSVREDDELTDEMKLVIGAYFTHEYSIEGAALTNPSIVPAPDQSGVPGGSLRVLVSLRAVGEGHISSIEFRDGVIGPGGQVDVAEPARAVTGTRKWPSFDKRVFAVKLEEIGADADLIGNTLGRLDDSFAMTDLERALFDLASEEAPSDATLNVIHVMRWLASSNYLLSFPSETDVSQRVLFPNGPTESQGMEDARFVRFVEDDGAIVYYGTYTAYDGLRILPQLIVTTDFREFRIATLNGPAAQNKGMALFPRRVSGRYAALSRLDAENNLLMFSDNVRSWQTADTIQIPSRPWELMQIGNAGSPIETEAGWLVVTHGVGPMRQYALGAILLDLDDPRRVIGHLRDPLLEPDETERDGYVPNVVYSCGSVVHDGHLVIAYGASDTYTRFATVPLDALLTELTRTRS
ncbi:glycoside hydrolase family 130 protein [soil metagenome]